MEVAVLATEMRQSAVAQCDDELSALFERESAPVAQWIRAADFGLSRPSAVARA